MSTESSHSVSIPDSSYECHTIPPKIQHTATVIWLHGIGSSSNDVVPFASRLQEMTQGVEHIKFILPSAHSMTVSAAEYMPAWFDVFSFDFEKPDIVDEEGMRRAGELVGNIIEREEKECGIPRSRIVLGGFSQGSATALVTAIAGTRAIAGAFVLGGCVPYRDKIKEVMSPHAPSLPIFWGHGIKDEVLKIKFSRETAERLAEDLGMPFIAYSGRLGVLENPSDTVAANTTTLESNSSLAAENFSHPGLRFVTYENIAHYIDDLELQDLGIWFRAVLPEEADV
ncbi:hypothetical protein C0991_006758 [Blastosporella zonata]|nr:hypothetical protein C0991_006758 [Blastosporella zonata]